MTEQEGMAWRIAPRQSWWYSPKLRSSSLHLLFVPRVKTNAGTGVFSVVVAPPLEFTPSVSV